MNKEELRKKLYGMTTQIHDDDEYQQSIWRAIADALEPIDKTVKETVDGIFIDKSTWELDFWEELYGLEPLGSTEDRKSAVKSNIRMNPTMTTEVFENIISSWKGAEVEVEEFYDEYRIEVRFTDPNETPDDMDALVDFMYEILPAHLAMSVGYKYIRIKDVHNKLTSKQMERLAMSTFATPEDYEVDGGYYTERLDLYNRDPIDDADRLFDLQAMLNDNWYKIDKSVALLKDLDKHINNESNPHNVTSSQVTPIPSRPSDVGVEGYPVGVTTFYINDKDAGYPSSLGTVLTVKAMRNTAFQYFSRNGYQTSGGKVQKGIWYRAGHSLTGWAEWEQSLNEDDAKELQNTINNLTKKDVGLGNVDNVKQASKAEFDNHTKALGTYQIAGHVKLSNATNSQSSVSDGVAATPKAVKDAYDHAGDAHAKTKNHEDNKNNPHDVTKAQVGLGNVANYKVATEAQAMAGTSNTAYMTPLRTSQYVKEISGENAAGVLAELNKHKGDNDNPHNVTKSQVGLGNVANYSTATQTEAEAGTTTNKYMTPKTTADAIKKQAGDAVKGHTEDYNNPHKVTKGQIGLGNVDNIKQASKTEFDRHTVQTGDFGKVGHVKLSNHTTSDSSVSDGVAATPLAIKTVNDRVDNIYADGSKLHNDITWIDNNAHLPSDTPDQYPEGVTIFKTTIQDEWDDLLGVDTDARYFITTYRNQNINVVYQKIVRMHRRSISNTNFDGMWIRTAFRVDLPWSDPIRVDKDGIDLGIYDNHINSKNNPHNVTSEQVNVISRKRSDVPFTDYPLGVSMFYTDEGDSGHPHRIVTIMTVRDDDKTAFQLAARNGYNNDSKHMWYRIGHFQTGWSEWYQIADNRDVDEVKSLADKAQKTADDAISKIPKLSSSVTSTSTSVGANSYAVKQAYDRADEALTLGVKQKQATADSLTSIGASLPDNPTWSRLQDEIAKADYIREAKVTLSAGQTKLPLDFYPTRVSGIGGDARDRCFVIDGKHQTISRSIGVVYQAIDTSAYYGFIKVTDKSIEVVGPENRPKPLPVDMTLNISGVAKK